MAHLEVRKGDEVTRFPLDEEAMSIGRLPGNSIVINDPDMSRRHFVIEQWEHEIFLQDLGSRNGTKVNGERVQRVSLNDGDVISAGKTALKFVAGRRTRKRSVAKSPRRPLRWVAAAMAMIAVLAVAALAGVFGPQLAWAELRSRFAAAASNRAARESGENTGRERRAGNHSATSNQRDAFSNASATSGEQHIEAPFWAGHYQPINPDTLAAQRANLNGRLATARFAGKPGLDHEGSMVWELPPDGAVIALLHAEGAEAHKVLVTLAAEPAMMEVNLAGVVKDHGPEKPLSLQVGVVEVLHGLGISDDRLQAATRRLLGKRIVLNLANTAATQEADE